MSYGGIFDLDAKENRLREVEAALEDPGVWNDPKRAQELGREKKTLDDVVTVLIKLDSDLSDNKELFDMSQDDPSGLRAIEADVAQLVTLVERLEFRRMFSNPMDPNPCYVEIQAGSGGTEAQDWASMLLRMYMRWIERHGFKAELMEESDGDVAGIKSATIRVEGEYAYGWLRTESGVHRLVRKSPFSLIELPFASLKGFSSGINQVLARSVVIEAVAFGP